ncbi:hypothetical protein AB834_03375 [PVC group bacterium (ex Bugula neritina AB1)]|nr:hypothetical protein AB834_03375 [PVC group bacterium (ex Bugula neritina AB1)]
MSFFLTISFFLNLFILPIMCLSQEAAKLGEIKLPQAMIYDKKQKCFFVAYLAGDPTKKNEKSYISKLSEDFKKVLDPFFCKKLNNPQSIALTRVYLVVADQGSVRFFDRKSGFEKKQIIFGELPHSLISDLVYDGFRFIYACDMFNNALIRIDLRRHMESTVMDQGPWIDFPKRMIYNNSQDTLFVGTYQKGSVYEFNPKEKTQKTIIKYGPFPLSGMAIDKDFHFYLSSDKASSKLIQVSPEKRYTILQQKSFSPSNIYIHPDQTKLFLLSKKDHIIKMIDLKKDDELKDFDEK